MRSRNVHVRRQLSLFRNPAFYFLLLLVCCGDVELNPGPSEQLTQLLEGQEKMMSKLTSIEAKQNQITTEMNDLKERLCSLEKQLTKMDDMSKAIDCYFSRTAPGP